MNRIKDLTGMRAGKLTAIRVHGSDDYGRALWLCRCDCGVEVVRQSSTMAKAIKNKQKSSCGCTPPMKTHGLVKGNKKLYWVWAAIIQRCTNESSRDYKDYGMRGIDINQDWRNDFAMFYEWSIANGYKQGLTIDRIDNDKWYGPDNCRWVGIKAQMRNQTKTVVIEWNGEKKSLPEWSEITGINYKTLRQRLLVLNWDVDRAMTLAPVKGRNQNGCA